MASLICSTVLRSTPPSLFAHKVAAVVTSMAIITSWVATEPTAVSQREPLMWAMPSPLSTTADCG